MLKKFTAHNMKMGLCSFYVRFDSIVTQLINTGLHDGSIFKLKDEKIKIYNLLISLYFFWKLCRQLVNIFASI